MNPDLKDVHTHFGLSYANYLVLPRTLLQSMPEEWQHRLVACLDELDDAFANVEQAECYDVTAGVEREIGDLTAAERELLNVEVCIPDEPDGETTYFYRGQDWPSYYRVVVPKADPVRPYDRGRAYVEPRIREQAAEAAKVTS